MRIRSLFFALSVALGVPIGAAGVASATSCLEPGLGLRLEVVEVVVDGEVSAEPEAMAPSDLVLVQTDHGRASLRTADGESKINLGEVTE